MKISGTARRYGHDIDTDVITLARYVDTSENGIEASREALVGATPYGLSHGVENGQVLPVSRAAVPRSKERGLIAR